MMKFKSAREQSDWAELGGKNQRLFLLLHLLSGFTQLEMGKDITITSIHRTEEENKAANAATDIHVLWKAADVSIHDFSLEEQSRLVSFCSQFKYLGTAGKPVALIHSVPGGAAHLHCQFF